MRLLNLLLGRESRRDLGGTDSYATWVSLYGMPDAEKILPSYAQYAAEAYCGNAVVFSVVQRRLLLFSEATFKFRDRQTKRLTHTPALGKLDAPWPNGSTGELLARMEQDVSIAGNAYVRDCGDRLERLRPDWVTIISRVEKDVYGRDVRQVIGYMYEPVGDASRDFEIYDVAEVAHWSPIPDPLANFRGMSWLTPVLREIDADIRMTAFRDAYFRNSATPNLIIKYQQRLGKDRVDRIRDMMLARHSGPDNAFKTMVLDEGADLTIAGSNMEGSAFEALQAAGEVRIANAAGVPPMVAGLQSAMKLSSRPGEYNDAIRAFADTTMRPLWRSACVALATLVEVPTDSELWYDVGDISALRPGELDAANAMQIHAGTANTLIMAGYTPTSVIDAITSGDMTVLVHSGLTSVQLYAPGENNSDATPDAEPVSDDGGTRPADAAPMDPAEMTDTGDDSAPLATPSKKSMPSKGGKSSAGN